MAWTAEHRLAADRRGLRYPSDLTDAEWALVAPLIRPAKRGGRPRTVDVRQVLNAIFYVLCTGCQWQALPKDLPPKSTVWDYLDLWQWDGTIERLHHVLYVASREALGREASPTTAIIDSQTAKAAQKGGLRLIRPGYDAGKKVVGRKRPHPDRHAGLAAGRGGASGRRAGPRWRGAAAAPGGDGCFPSSSASSAMPAIRDRRWRPLLPAPANGTSRSCAAATATGLWCSPNAGSSSAPWPGSAATDASPATSSGTAASQKPSSSSAMIRLMLRRIAALSQ